MSFRVFVVAAVLIVAFLMNTSLIIFEHVPEAASEQEEFKVEDLHKEMRWTAGTRRSNMDAFGLPSQLSEQVLERLKEMQKRDRRNDLIETMKKTPDVAGLLCSNEGNLPSRYQAVGMLVKGDRGTRRSVVSFDRLRNKIAFQEGFRPVDVEGMYRSTELRANAQPDDFALNVAALLRGEEIARIEGEDDWADPTFGNLTLVGYLSGNPEVELDMVEVFAAMHYLHEVARNPKNQFCGVRAGVTFEE
jgi:hypothetical protein